MPAVKTQENIAIYYVEQWCIRIIYGVHYAYYLNSKTQIETKNYKEKREGGKGQREWDKKMRKENNNEEKGGRKSNSLF